MYGVTWPTLVGLLDLALRNMLIFKLGMATRWAKIVLPFVLFPPSLTVCTTNEYRYYPQCRSRGPLLCVNT